MTREKKKKKKKTLDRPWRRLRFERATPAARAAASCCAAAAAAACGSAPATARSSPHGRATPAPTAARPTKHPRALMLRWHRVCRPPSSRAPARLQRRQWLLLRARATPAARAEASCCAVANARTCGSATASARSSPQGRATPASTAAPPTELPCAPISKWRRACRTPPGRDPARL